MDLKGLVILIALIGGTVGYGPVFLLEPPAQLTFSNTSGSQVSCSAHGSPDPQVDWLLQDGQTVTSVPGLRQSLGNGTLYFPPFRAEDYRKDIHSTVYRCKASNIIGTILSREVIVTAVVLEHYEITVYPTQVLEGSTAILSCVIPASVSEYVSVISWSRDDSMLLPGSNMGGRIIVTYDTGELHIRSVRAEDGLSKYSCLTLHELTQERKNSAPGNLTVIVALTNMAPRLSPSVRTMISAEKETDIHLICSAQGNPVPSFNWFRDINGHLQPVYSYLRYEATQDILLIKSLKLEDSGRWTCKVSNKYGEQRLDIHLRVTAHLSVHVMPQLQVINSGEMAIFNCTVSGFPMESIQWYRNGEVLETDSGGKIRLLSPLVLIVTNVTRHDRGMYQCMARNDRESAQGSTELRLGDTAPELQSTFIEHTLRPGPPVSLRCSASGSPPPQFLWLLDGEPQSIIKSENRYTIGQYVDKSGDVVSHLNFSNVRVEDGGLYSCRAFNILGLTEHSGRVNIYGPPFVRSIGPIKAVAAGDVTMHCPYSGYPIESVVWERHGQEILPDLRHRQNAGGSLIISRLDPGTDSGLYACVVMNREGKTARREIKLIIQSPPVIEPFSFSTSLHEGKRAQVTCTVTSGDLPIYFAWFKDGNTIPLALQVEERSADFYSMLIFKEVTSKHSGGYTCTASNSAAKANFTAQLMVKVAPQWVIEPKNVTILLENSRLIECSAKGFPEPQISWLKEQGKSTSKFQPVRSISNKATLFPNGSMYLESVTAQDEGTYLCRATNGIGSGISKVIYIGVDEPVRFDSPVNNISAKRGSSVSLLCQVYGDSPIVNVWSFNDIRLDLHNNRYSVSSIPTANGLKSQLTINKTDRKDSGLYKCLAENLFGHSDHTINLVIQERPDPPDMLEVLEVSSRSVRLAWRVSFDGNSPIAGYIVQYKTAGPNGSNWQQPEVLNVTFPATVQTRLIREEVVISSLRPATVYGIRVAAINSIDRSLFTKPITLKTREEEPSESPKDVRVEAVDPGELILTWSVPPRESWNGELLGYVIIWKEHEYPANYTKSITVKGWATNNFQLTNLKKYTRYDIKISAFNSVASGPTSPSIIGTTREGVPEAPPQNVDCSETTSQIMKISWTPPPPNFHNGQIVGYKVLYKPYPSEILDIPTTREVKRTTSTETYLHGLYKFTNYSINVLAYTRAGDGVISDSVYCQTDEDFPDPPTSIKAAALTGESILVSWLSPNNHNGYIIMYNIYCREVGKVGTHTTYNLKTEDTILEPGLVHEVRNLKEHHLYEFWVSASTSVGEGEPTVIVTESTKSRAPSRIVSFSQIIQKPNKSKALLPCQAVGNPTPRTRWIRRGKPITFSPFYEITEEGHLKIHKVDPSLAGNYTCISNNLFGEDEITYTLVVLMPPSAPTLEVQFTTPNSIRLHWTHSENAGTPIQGFTLNTKYKTNNWEAIELSPDLSFYTLGNLRCGSLYDIYLLARNKVGKGSPSPIQTVSTKGGPPELPKEQEFITANATTLHLNLYSWPNGGCPISHFSVEYRAYSTQNWIVVAKSVTEENIAVQDLEPATWYQLKISADNDAGTVKGFFNFATTTISGGQIPMPLDLLEKRVPREESYFTTDTYIIIISSIVAGFIIFIILFLVVMNSRARTNNEEPNEQSERSNRRNRKQHNHAEKTAERDNRKNCKQILKTSPIRSHETLPDDIVQGNYEILPYATFSVPGSNTRAAPASTLDYTLQFKTFGHIEEGDRDARYPESIPGKHTWHKNFYYSNEVQNLHKMRLRESRLSTGGDSDSDDSGSPYGVGPVGTKYRVPVKPSGDFFRPDSSTESNDVSPLAERRPTPGPTPRYVVGKRPHRPTNNSCEDEHIIIESTPIEYLKIRPQLDFPMPANRVNMNTTEIVP